MQGKTELPLDETPQCFAPRSETHGPSVVVLVQPPHWTIGFLANNVWSVAGHANFNPDGTVNKSARGGRNVV